MALTTKRIIALPSQTDPQEGDYLVIDNTQGGTKKIPVGRIGVEVDDTLTEAGKAADAKAVGDALDEIRSQIEVTGTASGSIATFADGSDNPMKSCIVTIAPQQSGTGTPSPDNIRPISGWESVEASVCGKNLWSFGDVTINSQRTFTFSKYLSSGDYSFSAVITSDDTSYSTNAVLVQYSDGTYGSLIQVGRNQRASGFFTASKEIKALCLYASTNSTTANGKTAIFKDVQLELGTTATAYEPYTGTTKTVNLGRTVYGGEAEIVGGSLTDKMGMIDLGDINWRQVGSTSVFYASPAYSSVVGTIKCDSTSRDYVANAVCSQYAVVSRNAMDSSNNCVAINKSDTTYISVKDSRYTDTTAFKAAMSGVKFCYELATPQTYQLTPTEVKTLLGENNVWADSGDVEVVYIRDLNLAINNLLNNNSTRSLGMMAMSAPTEATADEQSDEDMR